MTVVVRETPEHQVRKDQTDDGQGPDDVHQESRRDVVVGVLTGELSSPVPERRYPDLLQSLNDTSSQNPDFRCGTSFFTKVASEEQETGGRSDGVEPGRKRGDDLVRSGERSVQ